MAFRSCSDRRRLHDEAHPEARAAEPSAPAPAPAPSFAGEDTEPATASEVDEPTRSPLRSVELTAVRVWQQPGLCASSDEASRAQASLMQRFRVLDADGTRLYVDPRLPVGAHSAVLDYLDAAENEARAALGLSSHSPEVFIYQDTRLLLAAACINDDVVAYYDGAMHVVATRDDLRQSVVHEYAHHALMTHGIIAPAWAQEGIAMHVAGETWWSDPRWLTRLTDQPFALDSMEREVPYTLESEQAALFYVQSAVIVACAVRERSDGLAGLVRELRAAHAAGEARYALDVPGTPSGLRACVERLTRDSAGPRR